MSAVLALLAISAMLEELATPVQLGILVELAMLDMLGMSAILAVAATLAMRAMRVMQTMQAMLEMVAMIANVGNMFSFPSCHDTSPQTRLSNPAKHRL